MSRPKDIPKSVVTPTDPKFKRTYFIMLGALVVIGAAIALLLYWAFQPSRVLQINNAPFPVRTIREHPTANGVVILKVDYCKHTDTHGTVRTSFVSMSREVFLPEATDSQVAGCHVIEVPVLIPNDLPEDTYVVKFRTVYKLNPLKDSVVNEFESQRFHVDEDKVTRQ